MFWDINFFNTNDDQVCQEEAGGGGEDEEDQQNVDRNGGHIRYLLVSNQSYQPAGRLFGVR